MNRNTTTLEYFSNDHFPADLSISCANNTFWTLPGKKGEQKMQKHNGNFIPLSTVDLQSQSHSFSIINMPCGNNNGRLFSSWDANYSRSGSDNQDNDPESNENEESNQEPRPAPRLPPHPLRRLLPLVPFSTSQTNSLEARAQRSSVILGEALSIARDTVREQNDGHDGRECTRRSGRSRNCPPTFPPSGPKQWRARLVWYR